MGWPGEKVLVRVIDALENGIGGVLRPWQTRRVGRANAEARIQERLLLEQAELDISELKTGRKKLDANGKLIPLDAPRPRLLEGPKQAKGKLIEHQYAGSEEFVRAAHEAARAQEMQRAVNLKKIALYAEEEAEDIDRQSEAAQLGSANQLPFLDSDWFAKWRNGAQDVSKEEMQRLWGKLLAGEVAQPDSYSLHTIDFLSRMSSADAKLLARVAAFATSVGIIKFNWDFFGNLGLKFGDFLSLEDLGLINGTNSASGIPYTLGWSDDTGRRLSTLVAGKDVLIFDMGDATKSPPKMVIDVFTISRVGREVLTLASIPINSEYLKHICDLGISQGAQQVLLGKLGADGRALPPFIPIAKNSSAHQ